MKKISCIMTLALLTGALGMFSSRVTFDNSRWLSKNDPAEIRKAYIEQHFNQREELVVAIALKESFFNADILHALVQLEADLKQRVRVKKITHPLNVSLMIQESPGAVKVTTPQKLFYEHKMSLQEIEHHFTNSYYHGRYVSRAKDQDSFLLTLQPDLAGKDHGEKSHQRAQLDQAVVQLLKDHALFSQFQLAGTAKLNHELNIQNVAELKRLIPIIFGFIFVFFGIYYARAKALFIIVFSALLSLLGSLTVFYLLDTPLNILTSIVPLLIMAIAISDSIHIIGYYQHHPLPKVMRLTWKPCLVTSLTTALGFFSLYFSKLLTIHQLSIVAPIAILSAYLLIIGSNWSLLYLLKPTLSGHRQKSYWSWLMPLLSYRAAVPKLAGCLLFIIASSYTIYRLAHTETNLLDAFFAKTSPIQQDFRYIDQYHGGTGSFDFIIKTDFKNMATYQKIRALQSSIEQLPHAERVESYLMPVRMVHKNLGDRQSRDPATEQALAQELLFLEFSQSAQSEDVLRPFLSFDGHAGRLVLRTSNLSNTKAHELKEALQAPLSQLPWPVELAGNNEYFLRLSQLVLETQLSSLLSTLIAIFFMMALFYHWRASWVAVLANTTPICMVMLIIVLSRIPFDFSTVLISSICLGLAVDNSIHLIHHLNQPVPKTKELLLTALQPIGVVTLLFIGVFALFATSHLVLLQRFGLLSAVMVALAFFTNALLVPALYRSRH